jgi:hypothetical protein
MKKKGVRICLTIVLILLVAGGGLCVAAALMGVTGEDIRRMIEDGDFTVKAVDDVIYRVSGSDTTVENSTGEDAGQGQVLCQSGPLCGEINIDYGSLTIVASDSDSIYLEADEKHFSWSFDGTTLIVENDNDDYHHWTDMAEAKATLYLPSDTYFSDMEINVDAGSCKIEVPLICDNLEVDVDAGAVTAESIDAGRISLDCDEGKILFTGQVRNSSYVDVDAGLVEVSLPDAEMEDYNYNIAVEVGTVSVNDKNVSGLENKNRLDYGAKSTWELECDAGKIKISTK